MMFRIILGVIFITPLVMFASHLNRESQALDENRAKNEALLSPPDRATHYFSNPSARFEYVSNSRSTSLREPLIGKCFDLRKSKGWGSTFGTVTVYLEDMFGTAFEMRTDTSNFTELPDGERCISGRYRPE